jgi:hypothetical protein
MSKRKRIRGNGFNFVYENGEMYFEFRGRLIAKRGHPGTKHARTWIPLEPGYVVRDENNGAAFVVEYHEPATQ